MLSTSLIVQLSYGIPSLLLHFLILAVLFQHSCFDTAFYVVLKATTLFNLIVYATSFLLQQLQTFAELLPYFESFYTQHAWTCKFVWIVHADLHLLYIPTLVAQVQAVVLLTSPMYSEQNLRPRLVPIYIGLPLLAFALTAHIPFLKPFVGVGLIGRDLPYKYSNDQLVFYVNFVYTVIYALLLLILSITSAVFFLTQKKASQHYRNLFISCSATTLCQLVFLALSVTSQVLTMFKCKLNLGPALPYAWQLACLCSPWSQLCLNRKMREKVVKLFRNDEEKERRAVLPHNSKMLWNG